MQHLWAAALAGLQGLGLCLHGAAWAARPPVPVSSSLEVLHGQLLRLHRARGYKGPQPSPGLWGAAHLDLLPPLIHARAQQLVALLPGNGLAGGLIQRGLELVQVQGRAVPQHQPVLFCLQHSTRAGQPAAAWQLSCSDALPGQPVDLGSAPAA